MSASPPWQPQEVEPILKWLPQGAFMLWQACCDRAAPHTRPQLGRSFVPSTGIGVVLENMEENGNSGTGGESCRLAESNEEKSVFCIVVLEYSRRTTCPGVDRCQKVVNPLSHCLSVCFSSCQYVHKEHCHLKHERLR